MDKKTCLAAMNVINNLFTNEENYSGQFELTYTLNAWEAGIVPEFSWWGYINPGKIITQVFKNVELAASPENNYIRIYDYLRNIYGTGVESYIPEPTTWYIPSYLISGS